MTLESLEESRRNLVKVWGMACRGEEVGKGREALIPVVECPV